MKKHLNLIFLLFIILIAGNRSFANNIAAGEITYQWLADSTYRVFFKAYLECAGVAEPASLPLCITNTCTSTSFTATMSKMSVDTLPPPNCPSYPTKCTQPTSTLTGHKEVTYYADVTLPSRCTDWRFSATYGVRASNVNLGSGAFYVEASINNTSSFQGNSSPYFNNKPVTFICLNSFYAYHTKAVDPNGDSLVTDVIPVKTSSTCGSAGSVTLNTATPALQLPINPFQVNNTMTCNSTTSALGFTPGVLGEQVCAVRIRKYRGSTVVGYVTRELRFIVTSCSSLPYSYTISSYFNMVNCALSGTALVACPGTTMSYSIIISATDTNAKLVVSGSNYGAITYTNQNTDSVTVNFSRFIPLGSAGLLMSQVYAVTDYTCIAPGIPRYASWVFPYSAATIAVASVDTAICPGSSIPLSGGTTWSIVYGSPGSLSCTTCANPIVTPSVKSAYVFTVPACPNMGDTITIDLRPQTVPTLGISTSPGINIVTGTPVTFTANTTNCAKPAYTWKLNGLTIPGATGNTYTSSTLVNGDEIACELTCNDTCPNPKVQKKQVKMLVTNGVAKLINESDITVAPNPNNGIFTISTQAEIAEKYNLQVYNNLGQSVYKTQTIILGNGNNKQIDLSHLPAGIYTLMLNETPYKITITK
jgi:hypothetical protein